ncbi:MAG: response regulator transcription factor [Acidobacteria bacterium]|nr:response regulator transcription factor [Acidobacteriota bacterium]
MLIEDENGLLVSLTDLLTDEGYRVEIAEDGETGYQRAVNEPFHLIILDIKLPRKNGFDICRDLRKKGIDAPILMLTARGQVVDRVLGLKLGADDYLVKPFEQIELVARMEALLRRVPASVVSTPNAYRFGPVLINFRSGEIERNGSQIVLTALEYKLLRYFIEHRAVIVSRNQLLDEVWGYDAMPSTRTVDMSISGLRQKIETNPKRPEYLLTVHGFGYKFVG